MHRRSFFAGAGLLSLAGVGVSSSLAAIEEGRQTLRGQLSIFDLLPKHVAEDVLSAKPKLDHTKDLQLIFDQVAPFSKLIAYGGVFVVSRPIIIKPNYLSIDFGSLIQAAEGFKGDYLVEVEKWGAKPYFAFPIYVENLRLDCAFRTRGVRFYFLDHSEFRNIRIERPYGRGIFFERVRESLVNFPVVVNGVARAAFDSPVRWSPASQYKAGDFVRIPESLWDAGLAYGEGSFVFHKERRYFGHAHSLGDEPGVEASSWSAVPFEDYVCLLPNSSRHPGVFNSNGRKLSDRFWMRVHQDEAAIEVGDYTIDGADRTNQLTFISPVIRDCGHACYLRMDSSKTSSPVTHINIMHGHIHNTFSAQKGIPEVLSYPLQRMVEVGYGVNVNFYGTNLRVTDSVSGICVLVGDSGSTKRSQNVRFVNCMFSGDAIGQRGVVVLPSAKRGGQSCLESSFYFSNVGHVDCVDLNGFFNRHLSVDQIVEMDFFDRSDRVAYQAVAADRREYVSAFGARYKSDKKMRIKIAFEKNWSGVVFGDGGSGREIKLGRDSAGNLVFSGDGGLALDGRWNGGFLVFGSLFFWVDKSGALRKKAGKPSFDNDGVVVFG